MVHTSALIEALEQQWYAPPRWMGATEVQLHDGDQKRFLDYAAIDITGPYPELHGVEVKISRNDWLNEVRKPEKARAAVDAVDRLWLLTERRVFRPKEVPEQWGILVYEDGVIDEYRPAPLLVPRRSDATWSRPVMTTFLRRVLAQGDRQRATIQAAERAAEARGYRKGVNAARRKSPVATSGRLKYDPGRYNFDDGIPLDLP